MSVVYILISCKQLKCKLIVKTRLEGFEPPTDGLENHCSIP